MKPGQIYYLHLREHEYVNEREEIDPKGGCTVAFEYQPDIGAIFYALAFCNNKDTYNKTIGRMKAGGRLNSTRYIKTMHVGENVTVSTVIQMLRQKVYEEKGKLDPEVRYSLY